MIIGERLRQLRVDKDMSQGEIEARTGLLRCYISRVENGHTVPAVETLEKFARALEVPMYKLFYDGKPETLAKFHNPQTRLEKKMRAKDTPMMKKLRGYLARMNDRDRSLLLKTANGMATRAKREGRV